MIYDELGHAGDCKRDRQRVQSRAIFAVFLRRMETALIELATGPAVQVLRPDAPWLKPSGSESSRVGPKNEREAEQAQRYDRSRQQPAHWPTGALEE